MHIICNEKKCTFLNEMKPKPAQNTTGNINLWNVHTSSTEAHLTAQWKAAPSSTSGPGPAAATLIHVT